MFFFFNEGIPTMKYFSIKSVSNAFAKGVKETMKTVFARSGISNSTSSLLGLNVDGASVNMRVHQGLGTLIKQEAPWQSLVHCFNHRVEMAIKDSFANSSFTSVDNFLMELYYLCEKSPKLLREPQTLVEVVEKLSQNLDYATGTKWIDHKYQAIKIFVLILFLSQL